MADSDRSPSSLARGAAGLAGLTGAYGVLYLLGAFGPVSCWTSQSGTGSSSQGESSAGATTTEVSRGCESGIDYLLSGAGGNASVLFSWGLVLAVLVAVGVVAVWTGRRAVAWVTVVAGAAITVVGVFSIGWYFLLPTLFLLVGAATLSVDARRDRE